MKLKEIHLKNFRGVEDLILPFGEQLTLIVGNNGAGKSTVLDATALMLTWIANRIKRIGASGRNIQELDIHNGANFSEVQLTTLEDETWTLIKYRKDCPQPTQSSNLNFVTRYAKEIQKNIAESNQNCSAPILVYYPVNRAVLDIPLRIRERQEFTLLETYDESLFNHANFRLFFEWFRVREDFENIQAARIPSFREAGDYDCHHQT